MMEIDPGEGEVFAFITEKIDSVPHLEALLLLWNDRPKQWAAADLAARLYMDEEAARRLLEDLHRQGLIAAAPDSAGLFYYRSESEASNALIRAVDQTYRRQIVRVSTMIHRKASRAVLDFASAFRLTKERP
ncbi:MAG: hypothetical protein WA405_12275 [Candidatus Acidiferrales bacterium]